VAGATFAGLFFFTYFFTVAMGGIHMGMDSGQKVPIVDTLYYASVDGVMIGLAKVFLGTDGSQPIPLVPTGRGGGQMAINVVPPPSGLLFGFVLLAISVVAIMIAWSRVRAVEVVA
jgi:hypothetical protein